MAERFTEQLRKTVDSIWEAQYLHPFVRGIADGTLDTEKFKFYVRQDYAYLIDYARLFSLAVARSPDLETMMRFAELSNVTLQTEMSLHRSYAAEFGISEAALEAERRAPTCQAYCDFLLRVAALGDFAELVAALLPCMWGYSELGQRLARDPRPTELRYAKWIDMYSDPAFADLTEWCRQLLDRLAESLSESYRKRMEEAFVLCSRYELAFWEMAWRQEQWPV
jgi:thiaminase/transcriptional activator TenA